MKVRVLKHFYYAGIKKNLHPGNVVNIPDDEVGPWLKSGLAELDKVVAPRENKVIQPKETKAEAAEANKEKETAAQPGADAAKATEDQKTQPRQDYKRGNQAGK